MKSLIKGSHKSNIEFIRVDYEGISKVMAQFVELYKVCENKQLLDECLKSFLSPQLIKQESWTERS